MTVKGQAFHCPRCGVYFDKNAPESLVSQSQTYPVRSWLKKNLPPIFFFLRKQRNGLIKKIKYYSLRDLTEDAFSFAEKIPNDFDVIIGLPRAGLIVASIIAAELGRPLSTPDDFVRGIIWKSHSVGEVQVKKVLLVDEVMSSGANMKEAAQKVRDYNPELIVSTAALILSRRRGVSADFSLKKKSGHVVYEWESVKERYI